METEQAETTSGTVLIAANINQIASKRNKWMRFKTIMKRDTFLMVSVFGSFADIFPTFFLERHVSLTLSIDTILTFVRSNQSIDQLVNFIVLNILLKNLIGFV